MDKKTWLITLLLTFWFSIPVLRADTLTSDGYSVEDYDLNTAHDLADLCTIDKGHPDHDIAIAFCHGFFEGAIHYDEAIEGTPAYVDIVCSPAGTTREDAVRVFSGFINDNPRHGADKPIDAVFRGLSAKWPCPQ